MFPHLCGPPGFFSSCLTFRELHQPCPQFAGKTFPASAASMHPSLNPPENSIQASPYLQLKEKAGLKYVAGEISRKGDRGNNQKNFSLTDSPVSQYRSAIFR
ncbi:hypothetical protein BaRGS_00020916 [Batillaria attramentaria]|uniref:Uncharacterized protein n=1 Tax=Batillaria attramentaria TaxID=370345 RepID=A0ABD0KL86_9CAEN